MLYRRKRKIVLEELRTDNTPFRLMARDICELVLDLLDTRTMFNLMLVSKDTKAIAYSENHWKKRLHSLFTQSAIEDHLYITRHDMHATVPYRIVAVEIINTYRSITKQQFENQTQAIFYSTRIKLSDQALVAVNFSIGKYVSTMALEPEVKIIEKTLADFPMKFLKEGVSVGSIRVLNVNQRNITRHFSLRLLAEFMHRSYYSRVMMLPASQDLIITERDIVKMMIQLMIHVQEAYDKSSSNKCPFVAFMQKYINCERYLWLAEECEKIGIRNQQLHSLLDGHS